VHISAWRAYPVHASSTDPSSPEALSFIYIIDLPRIKSPFKNGKKRETSRKKAKIKRNNPPHEMSSQKRSRIV